MPTVGCASQAFQLGQRRSVRHIFQPRPPQRIQSLGRATELDFRGRLLAQGCHTVRWILDCLQANLEDIGQLAQVAQGPVGRFQQLGHPHPLLQISQHSLERRDDVGMARGAPQHLAVVVDGQRGMTKALAFHLGQLQGDGVLGGDFLGPSQHPDQVVSQILPAFRGGQKLLQ